MGFARDSMILVEKLVDKKIRSFTSDVDLAKRIISRTYQDHFGREEPLVYIDNIVTGEDGNVESVEVVKGVRQSTTGDLVPKEVYRLTRKADSISIERPAVKDGFVDWSGAFGEVFNGEAPYSEVEKYFAYKPTGTPQVTSFGTLEKVLKTHSLQSIPFSVVMPWGEVVPNKTYLRLFAVGEEMALQGLTTEEQAHSRLRAYPFFDKVALGSGEVLTADAVRSTINAGAGYIYWSMQLGLPVKR